MGRAAVTDYQCAHLSCQSCSEMLRDTTLHIETVWRRACFSATTHLGNHRALNRCVDIRVIEDDKRRTSAKFHRAVDDLISGLPQQNATDLSRTCEGQLSNTRIVQHRADHL